MVKNQRKHVVIVGCGFAGLNCAKSLGNSDVEVTVLDRRNHHLFQPLLYQVAMAGLSPADIAVPIRSILSRYSNIRVLQTIVERVDGLNKTVHTDSGEISYDYLVLAAGAKHSYFGREEWEQHAPGLKTLAQATEMRRRVLVAFEEAEKCHDPVRLKQLMTFVVVGGGPTGVELAGAIGEMSRYTLSKDFRNIDSKQTRIILVEGGERILSSFSPQQSSRASRELERLGVQVWTKSRVVGINSEGVDIDQEHISAATVLWAAGVKGSGIGVRSGFGTDTQQRVLVQEDLSLAQFPEIFVAGDQASIVGRPLPGMAPVALQQGRYLGKLILARIAGQSHPPFQYWDKGQMATIGRSKAVMESSGIKMWGLPAWFAWIAIHIFYLTGFRNRFFVVLQWIWSYLYFRRGARLIVNKDWPFYKERS